MSPINVVKKIPTSKLDEYLGISHYSEYFETTGVQNPRNKSAHGKQSTSKGIKDSVLHSQVPIIDKIEVTSPIDKR